MKFNVNSSIRYLYILLLHHHRRHHNHHIIIIIIVLRSYTMLALIRLIWISKQSLLGRLPIFSSHSLKRELDVAQQDNQYY